MESEEKPRRNSRTSHSREGVGQRGALRVEADSDPTPPPASYKAPKDRALVLSTGTSPEKASKSCDSLLLPLLLLMRKSPGVREQVEAQLPFRPLFSPGKMRTPGASAGMGRQLEADPSPGTSNGPCCGPDPMPPLPSPAGKVPGEFPCKGRRAGVQTKSMAGRLASCLGAQSHPKAGGEWVLQPRPETRDLA